MGHITVTAEDLAHLALLRARAPEDLPTSESPPGRTLRELDLEQCAVIGIALDGLIAQLEAAVVSSGERSRAAREIGDLLGRAVTTRNQLRRAIARLSGTP